VEDIRNHKKIGDVLSQIVKQKDPKNGMRHFSISVLNICNVIIAIVNILN
jgi:hypothetical protein